VDFSVFSTRVPTGEATYLGWLLAGLRMTVALSVVSWIVALALGSLLGVLRTVPNRWLSRLAGAYVEVFRNVPLLVQLFIWYFVLPEALPGGERFKQIHPGLQQFLASAGCLGLFTAARVCEQVRAGIGSLPRGQTNAGLALGLTLPQTYRFVLLPMAARLVVPPLTSELLNVFKNSAVCSTIGLLELTAQGRQLVDYTAHAYESFVAVTVLYLAVNATILFVMRLVERRTRVPGYLGSER
jgi:glutamate/aspartate transport system permease protein